MATKSERVGELLKTLTQSTPEIIGASLVSSEGFIVASVLPNEVDEDLIGGTSASLRDLSTRIASELLHAQLEQTYVRSSKGSMIVTVAGADTALVLLVSREAKLGLVSLELKRSLVELNNLL